MYFSWLYGEARTTFYHAETTVDVTLKGQNGNGAYEPLAKLCEQITPPCRLNPLLFNGHLQTAWTAVKNTDIPIHYRRKVFESQYPPYPGTFAVDFVVPEPNPRLPEDKSLPDRTTHYTHDEFRLLGSDDTRPMLVMLHGLSGGSHEIYLRHVLKPLCLEGNDWEACVVNSRGCANSQVTSTVLYNARATWDIRQTVNWIREKWPNRPLFGIGFSLGANILTNYLGEEGANCKLNAAVVVSNPWNLEVGSLALQKSFLGLKVYSTAMGSSMKALFERHVDQISKNPDIDVEKVRNCRYLHEFDRYVQCPTWKYPTEGAYYRDASSIDSIVDIRTPLFAIHAEDDPIAVNEACPHEEVKHNQYVVLCSTSLGGHLSWFETGGERWFARAAVAFLNKMAKDVDCEAMRKSILLESEANGVLPKADGKTPVYEPMRRKLHVPPAS